MSFDPYEPLPALPEIALTSEDFTDGGPLPTRSVMESLNLGGRDELPQLSWTNIPDGTETFALTCLDPDAPTASGFWHMSAFNIPATVTSIAGGAVRWDEIDWSAFNVSARAKVQSSCPMIAMWPATQAQLRQKDTLNTATCLSSTPSTLL